MAAARTAFARVMGGLGVRAEERRAVGLLALVFGLAEAGRGLGMNASDALFFLRFGVDELPWMYMSLGVLTFFAVLLYAAGFSRYQWDFLHPLFIGAALLLIVERLLIPLEVSWIYPALWLTVQVCSWVLVTAGWSLASQTFDTRQAKRLFSLFASASILGSMIGHAVTGWLAENLGTENLFLLYAILLLAAFQGVRRLTVGMRASTTGREEGQDLLADVLTGFRMLRRDRLLRLILGASVLFSVLFFSVWFPFSKIVSASYPEEAGLAGFLGSFTSIVQLSTLLLSLVSSRIYGRFGIVSVILLVPLIYLAGFGMWLLEFSLVTAVILRFTQLVWINGAGWTAWNALFNVYHSAQREQLRAFESGVPSQVGTSLSGVLLLLGERVLSNQEIFLMGAGAAVLCGVLCWRMRPAYGQALLTAIRSGLVDVFTEAPTGLGRLGADAQARESVKESMSDPDPNVRRIAAELAGRMGTVDPKPLLELLSDEVASVRLSAVKALAAAGESDLIDSIRPLLDDPAPEVRRGAVRALAELSAPLEGWIDQPLEDEAPSVRAELARVLAEAGRSGEPRRLLMEMLASSEKEAVLAALEAGADAGVRLPLADLTTLASNSRPQVRQRAVEALRFHRDGAIEGVLLARLGDDDDRVRSAAARAVREVGLESEALFDRLRTGGAKVQGAVLQALEVESEEDREALLSWTLKQMRELETLRNCAACLETAPTPNGRAELGFLHDLVDRRQTNRVEVILQALRKLTADGTIELVERGLKSKDREIRTQALEALETLGEKEIVRGFVPLLEGEAPMEEHPSITEVLEELTEDADPWIRAFSLRLRALILREQLEELHANAERDGSAIVQEVWSSVPKLEGDAMSETLDTLSTMDKILYLRKIPILDDLDPDDLHRIAEISGERTFLRGEYLCREGALEDELFLIVEGEVVVLKEVNGDEKELRRIGAGQPVGELAILASQPRSASVQATDDTVRVLVIGGQAFQAILRDRPGVATALLANLARRLSTMT